jgi:diguanylate cyclase (GGDEF)-like protein
VILLNNKKNVIIKVSVILIITLLLIFLEMVLLNNHNDSKDIYNKKIIANQENNYKSTIYGYRMLSKLYFDQIINKDNVLNIIEKADNATIDERKLLRKELNDILTKIYTNAVENNFRQFHFVLKDGTNFLRMHKIEVYGDNLTNIRDSVRIVNEEKKYIEGFEEGRIFNGYRYEYPLFKNDEYIGCVETSISFISIIKSADELFNTPGSFIIKKSVVNDKVLENQIDKNYSESVISNLYYRDKEILKYITDNEKTNSILESVINNKEVVEEIEKLLKTEETFIINGVSGEESYSLVFLEIDNIIGKQVGYLIFYEKNNVFFEYKKSIVIKSIFIFIFWCLLLFIVFTYYKSKAKIDKIIYFDKLTLAYNRNKLYDYIKEKIELYNRHTTNFSIIMYDIDYFKKINDNHGHIIGDLVLQETTDLVKTNIRITDYLFRFGGDEFIILLSNTKLEDAKIVAEKIRSDITEKKYFANIVENVTFSIGVTEYEKNMTSEELINKVDTVLYNAKETGRNKVASE